MNEKCECKEGKCLLMAIYPNSDAGMACDTKCYFTTRDGKKHLSHYKETHPEEFKKCME